MAVFFPIIGILRRCKKKDLRFLSTIADRRSDMSEKNSYFLQLPLDNLYNIDRDFDKFDIEDKEPMRKRRWAPAPVEQEY